MNTAIPTLPPLFDLAGTAVFALTGALLANGPGAWAQEAPASAAP